MRIQIWIIGMISMDRLLRYDLTTTLAAQHHLHHHHHRHLPVTLNLKSDEVQKTPATALYWES